MAVLFLDGSPHGERAALAHYPYLDSDWQQAAAHYARLVHVYNSLVAGYTDTQRAFVHLGGVIATSPGAPRCAPVKPLNVLVRNQSASGAGGSVQTRTSLE